MWMLIYRSIMLNNVTGKGSIEFSGLGFGSITKVKVDGLDYTSFQGTTVTTLNGTHSYKSFGINKPQTVLERYRSGC
ncbi:hypothetical protein [Desulfosporosinus nitroreducens]|uniref:hypothetical protein n=1 Tax=Desulfosporosinus nitroreducens TaxID=2018668 RepID=UPI00207C6BE5|nr:hypothetical protein [Desulfosporosinus nitroreducens]MCO1601376.1 hypothetical protein [Desulfosporosinus nitroreducens]